MKGPSFPIMPPSPLSRVRKICLSFPNAQEVEARGEPTFRLGGRLFAMFASAGTHHSRGHPAVWVKSTPVNQQFMVHDKQKRYFMPPYVGTSGWVGVRLDGRVNWKDVADILRDAYDLLAPRPRMQTPLGNRAARAARVKRPERSSQ